MAPTSDSLTASSSSLAPLHSILIAGVEEMGSTCCFLLYGLYLLDAWIFLKYSTILLFDTPSRRRRHALCVPWLLLVPLQ